MLSIHHKNSSSVIFKPYVGVMNNIITFVSVEGGGAGGGRGGSNNYISDFERNGWSESCTFGQQVSVNVPLSPS